MRAFLTRALSRISKLFGSSQLTALERAKPPAINIEEPDDYKTGGFHPISLGDTFGPNNYTILRKLGYGQYSTVWLARDPR